VKLFVDNLTQLDFSYLHPERGLLGESWAVQLVLDGALDAQGMVCDFGVVKRRVKQWLDDHLDHTLLVPTELPGVELEQGGETTEVRWPYPQGGRLRCLAPREAITPLAAAEIEPLGVAQWCKEQLRPLFPGSVQAVELAFTSEPSDDAYYYHYSHGLQQHGGNCQRIAHGHRSRIMIYRNGQRDEMLEGRWAERLRDSYIGSTAHLRSQADGRNRFAYTAPQGAFELELPARCCYLLDSETTVEQIAAHLAERIKQEHPQDEVVVRAFEGIGKGAIASA
jgi:6-pyruvoyl-tetrahydropterin synthase